MIEIRITNGGAPLAGEIFGLKARCDARLDQADQTSGKVRIAVEGPVTHSFVRGLLLDSILALGMDRVTKKYAFAACDQDLKTITSALKTMSKNN